MSEATFGERLAEARRIKGETIEDVSAQLRIRPSIILAMETNNFSHMPHKGYTRNMVSSYARYLGLDSTRITEQFLREFRRWESTGKRGGSNNASTFSLASLRGAEPDEPMLGVGHKYDDREMITAAKRNTNRSSVWGEENKRSTEKKFREQLREAQDDKDVKQSIASRRTPSKRSTSDSSRSSKQLRTNDYVGKPPRRSLFSGITQNLSSRPILLIIGLVVVFIAILILWAFLASTCSNNETTHVPVTGATGTDEGLDENQASNNPEDLGQQIIDERQYGDFELTVEVAGGASWLQIEVDGSTVFAEVAESPWNKTFIVSSEASVIAGAPSYVKVYRNMMEVFSEEGDGVWELKVKHRPVTQNAQDSDAASQR